MTIEEKVAAKVEAKKALEIARNLLRKKFCLEDIAEACNLTLEEVRKIQQSELAHC